MRKISTLLLFVLCNYTIYSQTISGIITDKLLNEEEFTPDHPLNDRDDDENAPPIGETWVNILENKIININYYYNIFNIDRIKNHFRAKLLYLNFILLISNRIIPPCNGPPIGPCVPAVLNINLDNFPRKYIILSSLIFLLK